VWRRHALVNANFAVPHVHMLQVKEGGPGFVDPSHRLLVNRAEDRPCRFAPARHADYLWYVGARQPDTMPAGAVVVWRGGQSFLARLPAPEGESGPSCKILAARLDHRHLPTSEQPIRPSRT
jgi:hypothetical protein